MPQTTVVFGTAIPSEAARRTVSSLLNARRTSSWEGNTSLRARSPQHFALGRQRKRRRLCHGKHQRTRLLRGHFRDARDEAGNILVRVGILEGAVDRGATSQPSTTNWMLRPEPVPCFRQRAHAGHGLILVAIEHQNSHGCTGKTALRVEDSGRSESRQRHREARRQSAGRSATSHNAPPAQRHFARNCGALRDRARELQNAGSKRLGIVGDHQIAAVESRRDPSAPMEVETIALAMAIASKILSRVPPPMRRGTITTVAARK